MISQLLVQSTGPATDGVRMSTSSDRFRHWLENICPGVDVMFGWLSREMDIYRAINLFLKRRHGREVSIYIYVFMHKGVN